MRAKLYYVYTNHAQREVKRFLEEQNIECEMRSVAREPLSWKEMLEVLVNTENGVEDILSTRSKHYTMLVEQGVNFEEMSLTEFHNLYKLFPTILKSPIAVTDGHTFVGYNEDEIGVLKTRTDKKEEYVKSLAVAHSLEDEYGIAE